MTTIYFTQVGINTWIVPFDWNNSDNLFEVIAGGGAGGYSGGGGGGYASATNYNLTPGTTIYLYVGPGGPNPGAAPYPGTNGIW